MPKTILILDDEDTFRELMAELLEVSGYKTYHFESKISGFWWALANHPDLIISDLSSPGMNGLEFLQLLRSTRSTSDIPVIILTGHHSLHDAIAVGRLGARGFMTKPCDVSDLEKTIEMVFAL